MARILILYYSSYGHISQLADAVSAGVEEAGGVADIRRVQETVGADVAAKAGYVVDPAHPEIEGVDALREYDAIVVGAPTRFGRMPSQLAAFLDQAGGLWQSGALVGKVGAAFTSTATQHGGQETTIFSILTNLLHFGMTIVGLDYGYQGQSGVTEVTGGSPYGASTIADGDGSRQPSTAELSGGRYLGARVARLAAQLRS